MAIEEEIIDEGNEGQESPSERLDRLEREQAERTEQLEKEREERRKIEIEAATTKGELEAMRRGVGQAPPPQAAWNDEQWEAEASKHGMSGAELKATVGISNTVADAKTKAAIESADAARREAQEAKEEMRRMRAQTSVSKIEDEFYRKNPALAERRADVDEFMGLLPEEVKEDPKKFSDALEKAKTFVRGKAREGLTQRRSQSSEGSRQPRNESREDVDVLDEREREAEVDVTDLDNEGSKDLIRKIARSPGPDSLRSLGSKALRDIDDPDELLKRTGRSDGRGVSIDESDEWARASRGSHRDVRDTSKRPLRDR